MTSDTMTLTGIVATTPRHLVTSSGLAITSFRLASGQRRFDRKRNAWVDADPNWYTVSSFRQLAHNVVASVRKGQHVVVTGRLRVRDWENADRNGTSVELEADAIGHDLTWCTTAYVRSAPAAAPAPRPAMEQEDPELDASEQGGSEQGGSDQGAAEQAEPGSFAPRGAPSLATLDS
ncbi:single-strand DNA-binding protein [Cryobacterium psychrotolerans]|uniref:Single-strand DNA-binding protein n=1 Tax=Cryobacterium psychrotolerans TaxID=386301 RepID=A0A1G9E3N1_9MICO|nr:single-stranded DNA-binding protein [Cryobacterium psychrotolerans]TFD86434.1 single-stranded DNA-binding protein [Cryobacterium psychrotolerans]SDK70755.1 single-strand DNA-binding protein [Cryobacterium psychrotolerans]